MRDLKACLICLSMDVKLYNIDRNQLRQQFNLLTNLQIKKGNGMPEYLCFQCARYLKNFIKFRDKCHRTYFVMQELLQKEKELNKSMLEAVDRDLISIKPYLSYLDVNKAHYEEVEFQGIRNNRLIILTSDVIPIVKYTTLTRDEVFEKPDTIKKETILQTEEFIKEENTETIDVDMTAPVDITCDDSMKNEFEKSTSDFNTDNLISDDNDNDNYVDSDMEGSNQNAPELVNDSNNKEADESALETEYATMQPISRNEAQAANEILKMLSTGKYKCHTCSKPFNNENRLKIHMRMHDQHSSGNFCCELCNYYYKSNYLLKTHMTEKHMYKYICRQCPEVNFDRISAKQHYILSHMQKRQKTKEEWEVSRPNWLNNKGGARVKGVSIVRHVKKRVKLPDDFLVYSPVSQEEQYQLILDRKKSRNYLEAKFRCELCFRGYREQETYSKHMRNHDPEYSGQAQCDMCKLYFNDARKMYAHMTITHIFKYTCQMCTYVCFNKTRALMHYRWHKNVTYSCPHCFKEFKKISTKLTHIRAKHPSSFICNLCGHSFVSDTGLDYHKRRSHTVEEIEAFAQTTVDTNSPFYCAECDVMFVNHAAFDTHLGSSKKHAVTNSSINSKQRHRALRARDSSKKPFRRATEILNNGVISATKCEICNKLFMNDLQTRKHYKAEHPNADFLKRYMCDVCGHSTKQYSTLLVHMRIHSNEKPHQCPHCDMRFKMSSTRDRHLLVHTGEKRYQCQHCQRRFAQSNTLKLHIQTVHLKIPYAPWDKKNRKRRKQLESTSAPVSTVDVASQPQPKKILDQDYLNAYINYNDK